MSYLDWHIGMQVVCASSEPARGTTSKQYSDNGENCPRIGETYTIRAIMAFGDFVYIHLKEVTNSPANYNFHDGIIRRMEAPFLAQWFRPVQKRSTDISIFTALLNPTEDEKEIAELEEFILAHTDGIYP